MPPLPKIIIIVGPTASGKSVCGIEIARKFGGEVICVDSRTVYRGMDIGTAKVVGNRKPVTSNQEEPVNFEDVPHWGLDLANPNEEYTVAMFQAYAQEKIGEILARGKLPVLVGGTGLWMDAVVDNLSFPEVPPNHTLRAELEVRETEDLAREYLGLDPDGVDFVDVKNKRRLIRAIEVCRATGKPFSELRQKGPKLYDALWLGMDVPRDELDARINARVEKMIADGLVEEVQLLREKYGCGIPAMSGIGYCELCEYFDGKTNLEDTIEDIKVNTRRFSKRQLTWFKRRKEIVWVRGCREALKQVETFLKQNIRA